MRDNHLPPNWRYETVYLARYAGSGVVNTMAGFIVIFTAMALGASPITSNIAGYVVGCTCGFVLSKKFVFRSGVHFVGESIRYLFAFTISFLLNLGVLRLALNFNVNAVISQLAAAVSYTLLMYMLTRLFVFDTTKATGQSFNERQ